MVGIDWVWTYGTNLAPITVLGEVLAQWPQMFRILNLFRMFFFPHWSCVVRVPDDTISL